MNRQATQTRRIIRPQTAMNRAGISRTTFWRRVKSDPTFPKPFRLGTGARAVGMFEDEFDSWLAECSRQRQL